MKPALDLQAELDRLEGLTLFELRNEWRRLYRMAPPMRLSRDLTLRGIAYKLQEREHGGLPRSMLSRLSQSAEPVGGTGLAVTQEAPRQCMLERLNMIRERLSAVLGEGIRHGISVDEIRSLVESELSSLRASTNSS